MSQQLNFEDFIRKIERKQTTRKSAEIRLDLNRLAPQKRTNQQTQHTKHHHAKRKKKRSRKVWETQAFKDKLEQKQQNGTMNQQNDNAIRAKTRVHLHKILLDKFNESIISNSANSKRYDELNDLCKDIENCVYIKSEQQLNSTYMEYFRNLLFNLKQNESLQSKLIHKDITVEQFVNMDYSELASEELVNHRDKSKKQKLDHANSTMDESNHNWVKCSNVECTNCGCNACKYKPRKTIVFETTKSVVYGQISSKQQYVDMVCIDCGYCFKHDIAFN